MKSEIHKTKGMKWSDLDPAAQACVVGLAAAEVIEKLTTWHFIYHRPAEKTRGPKWMWYLLSFINVIGPAAYFLCGRKK
ncbi:PLDc N-terminal domain-containing protein [Corynebacterium epidermidicanis]|uniref:Phospholipase_D-nuclease N-terminal n=1 Tax=Corynebacterium epidermidicanis TaxID=1050174 RepID=A0A0G3GUI6_9CORY|nr:PLDc N-terminal domain-containing protein [Corynebacterium epidermidicanis]AKK03183.1 Phospholipase_D-nuclease N-terminal [Corynebacterium epidermidicanis]